MHTYVPLTLRMQPDVCMCVWQGVSPYASIWCASAPRSVWRWGRKSTGGLRVYVCVFPEDGLSSNGVALNGGVGGCMYKTCVCVDDVCDIIVHCRLWSRSHVRSHHLLGQLFLVLMG